MSADAASSSSAAAAVAAAVRAAQSRHEESLREAVERQRAEAAAQLAVALAEQAERAAGRDRELALENATLQEARKNANPGPSQPPSAFTSLTIAKHASCMCLESSAAQRRSD